MRSFTSRFEGLGNIAAWFTLIPGLTRRAARRAVRARPRERHVPARLDTEHTRGRWVSVKLALTIGVALLLALAMTVLATWWRTPLVHLDGRMDNTAYDSEGTVVFGYTLLALGIALAVGVVWRRTVPALMIAFAAYVASRIFVDTWLRQRFQTPLTATWRLDSGNGPRTSDGGGPASLDHAWVLSQYPSDRLGHALTRPCLHPRRACSPRVDGQVPRARRRVHARRLPAGQPLLDVPGDRDGALRRHRGDPHRVLRVLGAAPGRVIGQPNPGWSALFGAHQPSACCRRLGVTMPVS